MSDNPHEARLERALRALKLLRAQITRDREALADAVGPELQAAIGMEVLKELSDPPDVAAITELAAEAVRAHEAARQMYLGMTEIALTMIGILSQGQQQMSLQIMNDVERAVRERPS